jgi:hypothetical protein
MIYFVVTADIYLIIQHSQLSNAQPTQWEEYKIMLWKSVLFGNSDFDLDNSASLKAFKTGLNVELSPNSHFLPVRPNICLWSLKSHSV